MSKKLTKEKLITGIKVIIKHLSSYRKEVVFLSIISIAIALIDGVVPFLAGSFFDSLTGKLPTMPILNSSLAILVMWIILQIITSFLGWISSLRSSKLGVDVYTDYIIRGYGALLELPMSFHKKHKIGNITNKINRAAYAVENIPKNYVIDLAPQFLSIIVGFGLIFYISPIFSLVQLIGLVVYLLIMVFLIQKVALLQEQVHVRENRAFGDIYDTVTNAYTVKSSVTEKYEQGKMRRDFKGNIYAPWLKMTQVWEKLSFTQKLVVSGTQATIFFLSIVMVKNGDITLGNLFAFNAYAAMFFGPFVRLGHNWQFIQNGLIQINFAEKIISTKKEIYEPVTSTKVKEISGAVKFKNVSFYYEIDKPVVSNINFEVNPGEVVALVGKSGEGKSTLVDLISGYHFAKKGKITIDGHNIKDFNLKFLRSHIAVVPQEVVLFNDTIEKNIKYGNFDAPQKSLEQAAQKAHALEFIEKFPKKWRQVVGERGVKLSVGQKQRVAIARAILRNPKILILDEPTSALDAESESFITKALEELMKGRTTFIIAHRLSTVRRADKILVFKDGQIVEMGKHDELIQKEGGVYRHLYELQIGLHK